MPYYFYLTTLCVITVFMIIHEVYLFNIGKYYPYLTRNPEDGYRKIISYIGLIIIFYICLYNLSPNIAKLLSIIVIISLVFCISLLNYLSYRKIKDAKIIYQTVILDIFIIVLLLWNVWFTQKG